MIDKKTSTWLDRNYLLLKKNKKKKRFFFTKIIVASVLPLLQIRSLEKV